MNKKEQILDLLDLLYQKDEKLSKKDSIPETLSHINKVQRKLLDFIIDLLNRALVHDKSKLVGIEKEFLDNAESLKTKTYSKDYLKELPKQDLLQKFLDSHYSKNSHHPEHYGHLVCKDCRRAYKLYHGELPIWEGKCDCGSKEVEKIINLRGMNLGDIVEMYFDWWAATEKHINGDMLKSIEINKERFNYGDDIESIFINTFYAHESNKIK